MAWKTPRRLPKSGDVLDIETVNEAIVPFVEEEGFLNEHNLSTDFTTMDYTNHHDQDVCWRLGSVSAGPVDIYARLHYNPLWSGFFTGLLNNSSYHAAKGIWQPIADMTYQFYHRGGLVHVIFSGQYTQESVDSATDVLQRHAQARFAILVDGAVHVPSITGASDVGTLPPGSEWGAVGHAVDVEAQALLDLPPGLYTVQAAIDMTPLEIYSVTTAAALVDYRHLRGIVTNRELILWTLER